MRKQYETYVIRGSNSSLISASGVLAIEDVTNAKQDNNLPHNTFTMANLGSTCKIYIYLDRYHDITTKPDYVLFPNQQITVTLEDGVHFSVLYIRNSHASTEVATDEIKYKIATVKEE